MPPRLNIAAEFKAKITSDQRTLFSAYLALLDAKGYYFLGDLPVKGAKIAFAPFKAKIGSQEFVATSIDQLFDADSIWFLSYDNGFLWISLDNLLNKGITGLLEWAQFWNYDCNQDRAQEFINCSLPKPEPAPKPLEYVLRPCKIVEFTFDISENFRKWLIGKEIEGVLFGDEFQYQLVNKYWYIGRRKFDCDQEKLPFYVCAIHKALAQFTQVMEDQDLNTKIIETGYKITKIADYNGYALGDTLYRENNVPWASLAKKGVRIE